MTVDVHKSNFDFTWYLLFIANNETVYIVTIFFNKSIIFFFVFVFVFFTSTYKYLCNLA